MELVPTKFPSINQNVLSILDAVKDNKYRHHELFPKVIDSSHKKIKYPSTWKFINKPNNNIIVIFIETKVEESSKKPYINTKQLEWIVDLNKSFDDKFVIDSLFVKLKKKDARKF